MLTFQPGDRKFPCPAQNPGVLAAARRAAFTLLEVIVAMGILTVMILMIVNLYQQASFSWNVGIQSSEMNSAGRGALEFLARELAQAVAGKIDLTEPRPAGAQDEIHFYGDSETSVRFMALSGDVDSSDPDKPRRALRSSCFTWKEDDQTLCYYRETGAFNPYREEPPDQVGNALVDNVIDFRIEYYRDLNASERLSPPFETNTLPACADIYAAVLGYDDAKKARALGAASGDFIERNSRRFATRVYFNNRHGWPGL